MDKIKENKFLKNPYVLILFALITFVMSYIYIGQLGGDDVYWHVKAGELICKGKFPFYDVFSWIYAGKNVYWVSHEWLTEVILYFLHNKLGNLGLYVYIVTLEFLIISLVVYFNRDKLKKNFIFSLIWFGWGLIVMRLFASARPHLVGFVILIFFLHILYKFMDDENYKGIYLLPILTILWVNFHGGSSNLAYIIPFIFYALSIIPLKFGKIEHQQLTKKQSNVLKLIILLNVLALFINPHTYKTVLYPFEGMTETFQLNFINEWLPINVGTDNGLILIVCPILTVLVLIATNKKIKLHDIALFGFFAFLTLKSTRFGSFFFIVNTFIVMNYINEYVPQVIVNIVKEYKKIIDLIVISVSSIFIIFSCATLVYGQAKYIDTHHKYLATLLSDKMIKVIKKDNPKRLMNHYDFGGELIYNDVPVFIDSRADIYWGEILENGMELVNMRDMDGGKYPFDVYSIMNKYKFDAYLLFENNSLYKYLNDKYDLDIIAEDKDEGIVYFRIKNNKTIPNKYIGKEKTEN